MTELKLYKFITENNIEWHKELLRNVPDIVIFCPFNTIEQLHELLDQTIFDDEGIKCHMKDGYLAIWIAEICEHYDIEIDNVFIGANWHEE